MRQQVINVTLKYISKISFTQFREEFTNGTTATLLKINQNKQGHNDIE